jgi:hypothetical protein
MCALLLVQTAEEYDAAIAELVGMMLTTCS